MVKFRKYFAAAIIIIAAATVVYFVFFGLTEEQKILRMLNELCIDCAKNKESSSAAALIVKTNVIKKYFVDPCKLDVHRKFLRGSYSDVRIANEIMRANLFFENTTLSISDVFIEVTDDTAAATFTGRFRGTLKTSEQVDEAVDVHVSLRKVEKKWKIAEVTVQEILARE